MTSSAPLVIDRYDSLSGKTLVLHFTKMDSLLWEGLSLLAQVDPLYLRRCCMLPIIKEVTGTSHGRRWFINPPCDNPIGFLIEIVRLWTQERISWMQYLQRLRALGFYRDTLRMWVEHAEPPDLNVQTHVRKRFEVYLKLRSEICTAYLPLVWKTASSHGFTDDSKRDLFQIGVTGLIHATERYHNVGPVTFSTFANRWIRQAILMYISRKMPIVQVSHSVLEEESKILRRERETGQEDDSPRAQRIKRLSSTKDVLLCEDVEAEQEERGQNSIDLTYLPKLLRQIIILKHGLLEHARCEVPKITLDTEREQQFKVLSELL
jgi:RNA polymerase sigma factor (sigma-70 family)